jgi:hypothetical protein
MKDGRIYRDLRRKRRIYKLLRASELRGQEPAEQKRRAELKYELLLINQRHSL